MEKNNSVILTTNSDSRAMGDKQRLVMALGDDDFTRADHAISTNFMPKETYVTACSLPMKLEEGGQLKLAYNDKADNPSGRTYQRGDDE